MSKFVYTDANHETKRNTSAITARRSFTVFLENPFDSIMCTSIFLAWTSELCIAKHAPFLSLNNELLPSGLHSEMSQTPFLWDESFDPILKYWPSRPTIEGSRYLEPILHDRLRSVRLIQAKTIGLIVHWTAYVGLENFSSIFDFKPVKIIIRRSYQLWKQEWTNSFWLHCSLCG